ncbi:hypothetical protein ABFS82_13G149700 [Erythranthe guttata]|uniref:Uncharacterized protein n=1 Tax=Erythranthe guttata TaxID=4155 RepID=A0A022QHX8_ERYGU|nr:PREDICTED: uncharacterized protein LOC105969097 [Erythranthe guttata]EYU27531.1 hypothetical protein MIMGU_mgv1a006841mg [Erythranthe guttata]|eukprot:XP_012849287.1 PREDICTED: uncharacterized protein LOC105969097 [Erythranthe guttata]
MASACVNNIGMSSEKFLDCPPAKFPSYGWLSPRISFSREFPDDDVSKGLASKPPTKNQPPPSNAAAEKPDEPDLESSGNDFVDFEFRLVDPVMMLPADELFANGKLVPLHLSNIRHSMSSAPALSDVRFPDTPKFRRRNEVSPMDPYLFSPKAPRCSSRWKELLGLKKLYQSSNAKQEDHKTASSLPTHSEANKKAVRSLKHLIQRSSKSSLNTSSIDSSLNLPLLKDSDSESVSISSRLSLSSSSSGHEHDDIPRLSLDSDKPSSITTTRNTHHHTARNISRARVLVKHRTALSSENPTVPTRVGRSPLKRAPESSAPVRGVSVDSPRMNSYGQIVFHSLERSSSSPSTFNGGPRHKQRGMERSYSANVRITPVLNVPVCSLRGSSKSGVFGFPLFYSQQKKETGGTTINGLNKNHQHHHSKNRTDRT